MSVPLSIKTEEVILENADYNSAEELDDEMHLQLEDSVGEYCHVQYATETSVTTTPRRQQHTSSQITPGSKNGSIVGNASVTNKNMLDNEKRMRREIANSNERRRMQSINAGFQNLRSLLPRHEGEKLSKAAILQHTSQYICELENQKTMLLEQNSKLKRQLGLHESGEGGGGDGNTTGNDTNEPTAVKKRLGSMSPEPMTLLNAATGGGGGGGGNMATTTTTTVQPKSQIIIAHNTKELLETKKQLDKERRLRSMLEEELQTIKRQLYSVATAPPQSSSYMIQEVGDPNDDIVRDDIDGLTGTVSYVEIDELTGQQQVVVCSSIEELESETAEIITEDNVHEEVILTSSTESEQEVNVKAIAKAYAEGNSPILQAAIKSAPKVEVERINETIMKVKTEKIEQPSGLTRIVEAIRHLEGDGFGDVGGEQHLHHHHGKQKTQEAPLALTTKQQQQAQRAAIAELRPYLQLKSAGNGNKHVTILSGSTLTLTNQQLATKIQQQQQLHQQQTLKDSHNNSTNSNNTINSNNSSSSVGNAKSNVTVTPTAIFKVQTSNTTGNSNNVLGTSVGGQVTITTSALKQCRPGVIVAKQLS